MSKTKIFIYGSLLPGCSNHRVIENAEALGEAQTHPQFDLVDLGAYPALVADGQTSVRGVVYAVDGTLLQILDEFEDHPDLYQRVNIELADGESAQTYLFPRQNLWTQSRVESGDWRVYVQMRQKTE